MRLTIISIAILTLLITSCKSEFTSQLRTTVESKGINLKKIQYYTSETIELKRVMTSNETKAMEGDIVIEEGQKVEMVIIEKGTMGICESMDDNSLVIRFEPGAGHVLKFRSRGGLGYYEMFTEDPKKKVDSNANNLYWTNNYGKVQYGGKEFIVTSTFGRPKLMIKKKDSKKTQIKKRKASGMKVAY
ncbi:MAG: hypothetical protein HRT71_02050 [Flavobacteriales bacterium]|nr:hypothetical protein [Flavobacteriales bacterium]